ncbi:glycosyltransferase family protein [Maricurvus nonylphenolicus]|uniref:MJ1255/VC2487 family glycosyltransferase n=1 Tax=Maricurvus nonylphenolicus TaxID=1008307 RepID=UPI0036F27D17
MRILYGVQGTGNGHLSRARAIAPHLAAAGAEVTYLFSGRERDQFFDMEPFGDWICLSGMTLLTANGKVRTLATAQRNNPWRLWQEIKNLDLSGYDLVITDFEPVSAWAARRQKVPSIAVGHQYAFHYDIPQTGDSIISRNVMRMFAPAKVQLGLHWYHFEQPILPPICDLDEHPSAVIDNKIIVYLGFESPDVVIPLLKAFPETEFYYYCAEFNQAEDLGHIHKRPICRDGFKKDLADCYGVICNAGFELVSEALHLSKRVLVKPLHGQMEQLSNALALEQLDLGSTMDELNKDSIGTWLKTAKQPHCQYPDVAKAIVEWIMAGDWSSPGSLSEKLWSQTNQTVAKSYQTEEAVTSS